MKKMIRIALAGDISLNNEFCHLGKVKLTRTFSKMRKYLNENDVDLFMANLESPLVGNGEENLLKKPRLKTDLNALESLKVLSPDVLVLGNNHIYDCLEEGFDKTVQWLEKNKINYVGACKKGINQSQVKRLEIDDRKISLLSYVGQETHPSHPENSSVGIQMIDPDQIVLDIGKEEKGSIVIVSLHWGLEFNHYPSPTQREWARSFVDAGARVVMGHHAHSLQGFEKWKEGVIFYNLGNFAFADVHSDGASVLWTRDQSHGGLAVIDIDEYNKIESKLKVTTIEDYEVKLDESDAWSRKVNKRNKILQLSDPIYNAFWKCYQFWDAVILPPFRYFLGERKNFIQQVKTVRPSHLKKIATYCKTYFSNVNAQ